MGIFFDLNVHANNLLTILRLAEESPSNQRQARREGGERQVCASRSQDAREARRPSQAQREEEQDAQVIEDARQSWLGVCFHLIPSRPQRPS
jgi:hypothetical protein